MAQSHEEKQHDLARSVLHATLGPLTFHSSLLDLVEMIIKERDGWMRLAKEREKDLQDATETNRSAADELRKEQNEALAILRDDLGEASRDLGIVALAKRAAHQRTFWKRDADERWHTIERLKEELKVAQSGSKPRENEDRLDQELTKVRTALTNFGVPEVEANRALTQNERVGRLGLMWASEKTRADLAHAQLAALVADSSFQEQAKLVKKRYEQEDGEKFERVVWLRSYAKHRVRGRPIHTAVALADEHIRFWQEGSHQLRIRKEHEGKSEFVRSVEYDAIVDGLNVQIADLNENLSAARECAQESADIMRRARDRAAEYKALLEKAREILESVLRWFNMPPGASRQFYASPVRDFLDKSDALLKELDSKDIRKED